MNTGANRLEKTIRQWYILFIVGLVFIGLGVYTFVTPAKAYLALSIVFSLSFLITGLGEISFSLINKRIFDRWGWILAFGLLNCLVGILLLSRPEVSLATMPLYLGFLILFRSVGAISYAYEIKQMGVTDWSGVLSLGILGVIFSFILIWNPILGGLTIVSWTALCFLSIGILSVYLSLQLRKFGK
ncbi:HdeD family acid-resistance protein [Echinicola strongylocentroti]|uniref:HdeD family acid-resistance protein n=1 Tax=Echinicola strongylocentroti TaxID=1795355 RepID=A0A2Z4ILQ5_9BACT|nr:DUF308 domain-containing protein [Echinicola strongylocentroti]AWW32052.1 HdeD family acid-resistance protein [Echinicola strongylocentroti]